jgi:hypothetical protein
MTRASNRARLARRGAADRQPMTDVTVAAQQRLLLGLLTVAALVLYFVDAFMAPLRRPVVPHAPPAEAAIPISPRHSTPAWDASVSSPPLATRTALSCSPTRWCTRS